jgi:4-hydroxybenzoate polyprenyltransferase
MSGAIGIASAARSSRLARGAGALLIDIYLGGRLSVAGFSAMLPILGALSAGLAPSPGMIVGLVAVAMLFHVYAYLLNDVIDLDVDRREPQRAGFPLVRGALAPATALAIAAAQLPIAFAITVLLGGDAAASAVLAVAFVAMTAYDIWGKRCIFPPLLDLVQAIGWVGLLLYGAMLVGTPAVPTAWLALAVTAYVLLVNGVHGALRDLANDSACGARTTATLLGARVSEGILFVPRVLIAYALGLHGVLFIGAIGAWWAAEPLRDGLAAASFALLAALIVSSLALLGNAVRIRAEPSRARSAATWHLFVCMALLALPLLPRLDSATAVSLAAVYVLPILAMAGYRRREHR